MVICESLTVPKENANGILSYLLKCDMVRKDLKISNDPENVHIPLKRAVAIEGASNGKLNFHRRNLQVPPVERVNLNLKKMGIKSKFPEKFIKLGDSLFIKESRMPIFPREVYSMAAEEFQASSIYLDRGIGESPIREPDVVLLWGEGGTTVHEENGIFYSFDPTKVMFSPGNVNARIGESRERLDNMTVVDMFAGIGYFSLQIAKGSQGGKVYACELNPNSYSYLVKNIEKNRLGKSIVPLPGDCRLSTAGVSADYILMGHFDSLNFLSAALRMSHKGTLINMHILCDTSSLNTHWQKIQEKASHLGYLIDFKNQNVVKSYGPHLWHVSTKMVVSRTL